LLQENHVDRSLRSPARAPRRIALLAAVGVLASSVTPVSATSSVARGPSTTTDPYVLPVADGVHITSLLTVNDAGAAGNGYEMVGIPDGIGAYADGNGLVALMNHELRDTQGIARRHGQRGAFVSRLEIDPGTLAVTHGSDLIDPGVTFYDYPTGTYVTSGARFADLTLQDATFGRWCSSTLSDPGLFWSESKKVGYAGQLYFGNEEDGDNGRAFGVTTDGTAQALPRLGLFQWENTIPAANKHETTLVMGQEDGPAGPVSQLWVYVGTKQNTGNAFDRAGLTDGRDFVIDAVDESISTDVQWRASVGTGVPARVDLAEVPWNQSGAAQNGQALARGLSMNRIEDGFWDPNRPNDFYFVTTEGGDQSTTFPYTRDGGGLWRLSFQNIEKPEKGATLTLLLDGSEEIGAGEPRLNKPDNLTMDRYGNLLIQEDPGNNAHVARIIAYRIDDGAVGVVARFDPNRFVAGGSQFMTTDEESSGIIDTEDQLGAGTFLFDAQVHTPNGLPAGTGPNTVEEYVENGQLLLLGVTNWSAIYAD